MLVRFTDVQLLHKKLKSNFGMNNQFAQVYSYLYGIWSYRWSALVISWVVVLVGWSAIYFLPNQYASTAVMHIDTSSLIRPLLKGLAVETEIEKEAGILRRRLLNEGNLERIIRQTDLRSQATSEEAMARLTEELAATLTFDRIGQGGKTKDGRRRKDIYMLTLEGRSPELVYQIVSKGLDSLVKSTLDSARIDTASAQEFLNDQITEYEKRLSLAEHKLAVFTQENIGLMPDESGGYYNKLQREQEKLDVIRVELRLEEQRLVEMRKQLKGELPILGGQQISKVRQYREQLQDLLTQYTESHPDVLSMRSIIAEVLAEKDNESTDFIGDDSDEYNTAYYELKTETRNVTIEVETMKVKLDEQSAKVKELKLSVSVIPEVEAKLAKLNRDYDITKKRYLKMIERRESARLAEAIGQSGKNVNFKILSRPFVAEEPTGPDRPVLMSFVFLAALAAGLAWGFVRYILRPTYITLNQIDDAIGIPVLGAVGLHLSDEHRARRRAQLFVYVSVFSLLIVSFATVEFIALGMEVKDILAMFESSSI